MAREQDSIETELHNRLRQQEAVAELGLFALKSTALDELLNKAVRTISGILDTELCKVLEFQADGKALVLRAGVGWDAGLVGQATVGADRDSQAGYTVLVNAPVIVADLNTETRFTGPALLTNHGVVSGLSVVIHGDQHPFGVLGTHTRQRRVFSKDDASFVQSVANVLAGFIQRRRVETQYRQLVESVEDFALLTLDRSGRVITWNRGAERLSGFTAAEMIGQSITSLYDPEEAASGKPAQDLAEAAASGKIEHEGWRRRCDGSRFLASCLTVALKDETGKLCGYSRIVRDVTAQRREEESLRSIVGHSVDAIFTINEQGIIQSSGGAVQKIFDHCCCDLVGQNISILMPSPQQGEHDSYLRNYLRTGVAKIIGSVREVTAARKDGPAIPLDLVV
ncbi:MAG: PAS domain S-box protein, partial [Planctomycetes bacterium]|nr:PAS domain S-box protein [Planctomycetota bacterium]